MSHVSQGLRTVVIDTLGAQLAASPQLVEAFRTIRQELILARAYTPMLTHPDAATQNITLMAHLYAQIEFTDIVLEAAVEVLKPTEE